MTNMQIQGQTESKDESSVGSLTRRTALKSGLALGAGFTAGTFGIIGRASAAPVTMRFGSDSPIGAPHTKSALVLKDLVESRTSGRIAVTIFPDSQLGNNGAMLNSIKSGSLDAVVVDVGHISVAVPEVDVFSLPFLFKDTAQVLQFSNGPVGAQLKPKINEAFGCEVLGFTSNGPINMYDGKRPIRSPSDIVGLKMGGQASKIYRDMILAFGGIPTVVGLSDLYTSLQTNLIDGANSSLSDMMELKLYQVTKYLTLTRHYSLVNVLVVSQKFMDKLSPEDQAIVRAAGQPAAQATTDAVREGEQTGLAFLQDKGIQIVPMEDPKAFSDKMEPVYKGAVDRIGADLLDQARNFAAA